jgi:hypothetical protein
MENISFLEVNNVCDGGLQLLAALRERVYSKTKLLRKEEEN